MRLIDVIMITITALSMAVTLPIFGKEHVVDFGNTSDIVSAICNIAMAGAAVYAASKANDWFKEKMSENEFGIKFELRETVLKISMIIVQIHQSYYRLVINYSDTSDVNLLNHDYLNFNILCHDFDMLQTTMRQLTYRIEDRCIVVDEINDILELQSILSNVTSEIHVKTRYIKEIIGLYKNKPDDMPIDVSKKIIERRKEEISDKDEVTLFFSSAIYLLKKMKTDERYNNEKKQF